jgi:monoamine oxidase
MRQNIDRRAFLKTSATSLAALALALLSFGESFQVAPAAKPQKVIVVGAGIAGLVAAFELMQSGHDVTVRPRCFRRWQRILKVARPSRGKQSRGPWEPWSLGASAYFGPGEMTTMFPHVASVEGRVHFAGEHTSELYVMEGAAQSGVRAAREVGAA